MTISEKKPSKYGNFGQFFSKKLLCTIPGPSFFGSWSGKKIITQKNAGTLNPTIIIGGLYSPKIIKYCKK